MAGRKSFRSNTLTALAATWALEPRTTLSVGPEYGERRPLSKCYCPERI